MKRTLVISDIHGELALFEELLQTSGYNPDQDRLFYWQTTLIEVRIQKEYLKK